MLSIILASAQEPNILAMMEETEACFPAAQIIVSNDRYRLGKGWAIREALSEATGDIIVFIDGDGDISPKMINRLLPHLDEFDIVVGTKNTRRLLSRWILSGLARVYISVMFGIPVDTQTGIKVFKRSALPMWEANSFAFPVEILAKAQGAKMFEVMIETRAARKMKLKSIFAALIGSIKIWGRLNARRISSDDES